MSRAHPRSWRVLREEHLQHCRVFDVHVATMESPHTGSTHPFFRIESPAWVNVVALTPRDELVMVRHYRVTKVYKKRSKKDWIFMLLPRLKYLMFL